MEFFVMRRFVAKAILNTAQGFKIAWFAMVVSLAVLIPLWLAIAAYFDPIPRVALLGLSIMACVVYLLEGIFNHIYEWAKKSA